MSKNGTKVSEETRKKMILAQRKRMTEGRHNFYKGHPLHGKSIGQIWFHERGMPSPRKGEKLSKKTVDKMKESLRPIWESEEFKEKARIRALGKKQSAETIAKRFAARKGYRHSKETMGKMAISRKRGADHPNWKGGVTPINKKIRASLEFKLWREAVFKRDDYTCTFCKQRGGILHPDHIKQFASYPELRFVLENGRTLCKSCHMKTDTWGRRKKCHSV